MTPSHSSTVPPTVGRRIRLATQFEEAYREGEYQLANKATAEAYGLTPREVEGRSEAEIIPNVDDSEQFRADDVEVIDSGEPKEISEEELTAADGETRILRTTKLPYQMSENGDDAVLGYARD
ncbi:hypothetical protein JCM18237_07680 [Halorubrum luteum]